MVLDAGEIEEVKALAKIEAQKILSDTIDQDILEEE